MSRLLANRLMQLAKRVRNLLIRIGRAERLRIYLGRNGLAVCVVTGRFRPVVRSKAILPSTPSPCDGTHSVSAALTALTTWLRVHPRRSPIEWVIGIDHVRYLLLPWDKRLSSQSFCHTLAAALFAQQSAASEIPFSEYQIRFAPLAFNRPLLAALIPCEVIREITAFASQHQCVTRRITPALSAVWDRFFVRMKSDSGVLALVEEQRLLRVTYDHGHITSLSVRPFSEERTAAIPGGVTLAFPAPSLTTAASDDLALQGLAPEDDARFAYALCGVF
ncbi:hypothetical protein PQR67_25480 [Paraburkholderia fungorum]|uniref:hypothetical protein n=1 Tax=Paraburkholderia fungorum TaxID=134537 RepID=UPI0038BB9060